MEEANERDVDITSVHALVCVVCMPTLQLHRVVGPGWG